jgi:hypothetical protein
MMFQIRTDDGDVFDVIESTKPDEVWHDSLGPARDTKTRKSFDTTCGKIVEYCGNGRWRVNVFGDWMEGTSDYRPDNS